MMSWELSLDILLVSQSGSTGGCFALLVDISVYGDHFQLTVAP